MPDVVVMVSGCYDILHGGHVEFFTQARALGSKLVVCVASDEVLWVHKKRKSSIPLAHKVRLLESLSFVDEVVVGECNELGFDFKDHFLRIKPDIFATTEDDKWETGKIALCESIGAKYVKLPKTLNYEKVSTSDILNFIRAPHEVPLRVDLGGGWLDVPKFSRPGGFIVNCAISPMVSLNNWPYYQGGGLGGSAAYVMLMGRDGVQSELDLGVGWQDPAIIKETGLCAWRSGNEPILDVKINPDILRGKMALMWMGKEHYTPGAVDLARDYDLIMRAGMWAHYGVKTRSYSYICDGVDTSYKVQVKEGMQELPEVSGSIVKKYLGGGHGGYALYLFNNEEDRNNSNLIPVEPYLK